MATAFARTRPCVSGLLLVPAKGGIWQQPGLQPHCILAAAPWGQQGCGISAWCMGNRAARPPCGPKPHVGQGHRCVQTAWQAGLTNPVLEGLGDAGQRDVDQRKSERSAHRPEGGSPDPPPPGHLLSARSASTGQRWDVLRGEDHTEAEALPNKGQVEAAPREGGRGGSPPAPTAQSSSSSRADTALRTRRISSTLAGAVAGRKRESPPDRPRDHTCGGPGLSPHPYRYMSPAHPGPGNLEERPPAPVQGPGLWEGPQALPTPPPLGAFLEGMRPKALALN